MYELIFYGFIIVLSTNLLSYYPIIMGLLVDWTRSTQMLFLFSSLMAQRIHIVAWGEEEERYFGGK